MNVLDELTEDIRFEFLNDQRLMLLTRGLQRRGEISKRLARELFIDYGLQHTDKTANKTINF